MMIDELIAKARSLGPIRASVVHADDEFSLAGAREAERLGILQPVFDATPETAARRAADGDVKAIVKGTIHSDALLHAIVAEPRLHVGKRLSHVVVAELAKRATPLLISDAAVNIAPDLDAKREIVQNAIDVAHALGIMEPRVAVLSAVETVASRMPSTIDAAALTEMCARGQITGGIVDGPLALDDAISVEAASVKGIDSPAAGVADVLIAPDLESGNIIYKMLERMVHARCGGVVVGAAVAVILTSRADSIDARVISSAVARILAG
ncbi:MAG TPA: bifunctional enoyl-CoA hydratase/phosphate acetyltransferase [Candidatus Aquilonibacter sp.]|nr:bifunctional enoyl-CoA hydratase/phosphate acetyltransferase [Candidatus Aquilonibacter sp.]